jgi:hypothetical protein
MNERIEELSLQCIRYKLIAEGARSDFDYKKFAELIVLECAESLWTEECYNSDLALEEFQKNSKKIREHFGVEE